MTDIKRAADNATTSFSWNTLTPDEAREVCRQAQATAGLVRSEADGGFYLAARYEDVVEVMRDPATFSSAPTVFRPMAPDVPSFPLLEYDPPRHGPWREIFHELINPRSIKGLRDQVLRDIDDHIDKVIESGRCDLVADLAEYVPAETICRAAGIDDMAVAGEIRLAALAALLVGGRDPEAFALRLAEFDALVMPLLEQRRTQPREDFLTRLVLGQPDGRPLDQPELVGAVFGLLAAGHHSTTSAMAVLFREVLSRPEIRAQVQQDPKVLKAAVEESLRIDPPFYGFYRRATQRVDIAGTKLNEDDSVCLSWVGANHDPAHFDDPEQFRLDRRSNRHLAFGFGIHTCVGAPLARMELQLALERVLTRMPDVELETAAPVKYFGGAGATYIESLPARFTPGPRIAAAADAHDRLEEPRG